MATVTCRLFVDGASDGPTNMAADEVLLQSALTHGPALRFYQWSPATLSLGYFQPAASRQGDMRMAALPWVRRPSGGATLVHDQELTYCLVLPPSQIGLSLESWMRRMHGILAQALSQWGLQDAIVPVTGAKEVHGDVLCFQQYTPGDLLCRGSKIVGSAQRKFHQALMQHGSILLARSEWTPALPGIRELTGTTLLAAELRQTIEECFEHETGWSLVRCTWSAEECTQIALLAQQKYAGEAWNTKR